MDKYYFEGEEVLEVWESFDGSYWIITDKSGPSAYGYARLSSMPQFAEWGAISLDELKSLEPPAWTVPRRNWGFTGPSDISIEKEE
jgi:hypothetical protein